MHTCFFWAATAGKISYKNAEVGPDLSKMIMIVLQNHEQIMIMLTYYLSKTTYFILYYLS